MTCRAAEAEKERVSRELEQVWAELSGVVRAVYHLDNNSANADMFDNDRLTSLITRCSATVVSGCLLHITEHHYTVIYKAGYMPVHTEDDVSWHGVCFLPSLLPLSFFLFPYFLSPRFLRTVKWPLRSS